MHQGFLHPTVNCWWYFLATLVNSIFLVGSAVGDQKGPKQTVHNLNELTAAFLAQLAFLQSGGNLWFCFSTSCIFIWAATFFNITAFLHFTHVMVLPPQYDSWEAKPSNISFWLVEGSPCLTKLEQNLHITSLSGHVVRLCNAKLGSDSVTNPQEHSRSVWKTTSCFSCSEISPI